MWMATQMGYTQWHQNWTQTKLTGCFWGQSSVIGRGWEQQPHLPEALWLKTRGHMMYSGWLDDLG